MAASFVQVNPFSVPGGPKMQTFENLIGADQVHAEAVVIVNGLGIELDPATETTLASILGQLDVALSTRASEVTLTAIGAILAASLDTTLSSRASELTLASVLGQLDVALSSRASEATLVNVLTTAAFEARINTLGQKVMAASTPVVIASDQSPIPITVTPATVGVEGNAWNAVAVGAGGVSASVDCQYTAFVSCFGVTSAVTVITVQVSQDDVAYYSAFSTTVAPAGDFYLAGNIGARYVRLRSSAAANITATIAGKS